MPGVKHWRWKRERPPVRPLQVVRDRLAELLADVDRLLWEGVTPTIPAEPGET